MAMFLAFGILQVFALAGCATDGMPPSSINRPTAEAFSGFAF
jgi:hypothetical protein